MQIRNFRVHNPSNLGKESLIPNLKIIKRKEIEAYFVWKVTWNHQFSHQIDIEIGRQERDLREKETHEFEGRRRKWIVVKTCKKRGHLFY